MQTARALPTRLIQTEHGTIEVIDLTPEIAQNLLDNPHPNQRVLRERQVAIIAEALESKTYRFIGDSIKLDQLGRLVDGQHRCHAVVRTAIAIPNTILVRLADDDVYRYIDTGSMPRSLGDILRADGMVVPKSVCGAIMLENCGFDVYTLKAISKVEHATIITSCPVLDDVITLYKLSRRLRVTAGPLAGAVAALKKNRPEAMKFFAAAFQNEHVIDGIPQPAARLLANWLAFHRDDPGRAGRSGADAQFEGAYKTVRAWNAWRLGERLAKLQSPKSGGMPEVEE